MKNYSPSSVEEFSKLIDLGQAIEIISGAPFKSDFFNEIGDGLPLIRVRDVNTGPAGVFYSGEYSKEHLVQSGDLLVSMDGDFKCISWSHEAGVLNQRVCKIIPKINVLDKSYLKQFLPKALSEIHRDTTFTTVKHLSVKTIKEIKIPLPPIADQKRIAYLLGKVEGLIAQRKQHLQQLDGLLKSVFLEMFGDPVRNEKGWETKSLGKLASIERGRFSPRPRNDPKFYNGAHPFIQTGDISRSNGRLRDYTQTLNDLGTKVSKEFNIGTIVIAIVGATIGETAILEIATYAPDSVIGITPKVGDVMTESVFIEYILRFWKPVLRAKAPEAARANINIETLRPLPIIWPQTGERAKFATIVGKVEGIKSRYQKSLTDLETLYGALSQKAFKGELDLSRVPLIPDGTEAPAEGTPKTNEPQSTTDTFDLPAPSDLATLNSAADRDALLTQWLTVWLQHLNNTPFSTQPFIEAAQQRLWELAENDALELGAADYDQIKGWTSQSLDQGRLAQTYSDAKHRVQLQAVSNR